MTADENDDREERFHSPRDNMTEEMENELIAKRKAAAREAKRPETELCEHCGQSVPYGCSERGCQGDYSWVKTQAAPRPTQATRTIDDIRRALVERRAQREADPHGAGILVGAYVQDVTILLEEIDRR